MEKEILLEKLKELTLDLGRYPTKEEIDKSKITPHSDTYYNHFKKLKNVFKELNLKILSRCKICSMDFDSNRSLAVHLIKKTDSYHKGYRNELKNLKMLRINSYNYQCSSCNKRFETKKALNNHIFSFQVNDNKHLNLKNKLREERLKKTKKICSICNRRFIRNLGVHLVRSKDKKHISFYKKQKKIILDLFLKKISFYDMTKIDNFSLKDYSSRHFYRICVDEYGRDKVSNRRKAMQSIKAKILWELIDQSKRNEIMEKVRFAEWGNLTLEDRKKHPWVIAGKKASLQSSKIGSKNQQYAFRLLKHKFPTMNWVYNHAINEQWHFDIVVPEEDLYIEWDGRHHFVPIHGQKDLNNRINRDKIKNKIITKQIGGCLIRIKDEGKADKKFVEKKVQEISEILNSEIKKGEIIQL